MARDVFRVYFPVQTSINSPILKNSMHCDDKRTLSVLKENILVCFNELKDGDYENKTALKKLNDSIEEYNEYKLSI